MAVVNTKSTLITNADATPLVISPSYLNHARAEESVGVVAFANGDSIASVSRFCRVKSNERIVQVRLATAGVAAAAMDVGVYRTAADGGAVVDADFFASAVDIHTAALNTDITYEAGAGFTPDKAEMPLWQALGLTTDPMVEYDICGTLTVAATGAGSVALFVTSVFGP